jgi:hypothetical protein
MSKRLDDLTEEQLQWMADNCELIEQISKLRKEELKELARKDPRALVLLFHTNQN